MRARAKSKGPDVVKASAAVLDEPVRAEGGQAADGETSEAVKATWSQEATIAAAEWHRQHGRGDVGGSQSAWEATNWAEKNSQKAAKEDWHHVAANTHRSAEEAHSIASYLYKNLSDKEKETHNEQRKYHSQKAKEHEEAHAKAHPEIAERANTGRRSSSVDGRQIAQRRMWEGENYHGASEQTMDTENIISCRAAHGVKIPASASEPWCAGRAVNFIYSPEGLHTITAGFRKNDTITISVIVDDRTPSALQESFDHLCATQPKQEPYADEDHAAAKATLRFPRASTKFSWGTIKGDNGVVVSGGEPTSYGAECVNGKIFRVWSPEFTTDAEMDKAKCNDGHWTFPDGVRGSEGNPARLTGVNFVVGALTNRPAFRAMPPVKAKAADAGKDTVQATETVQSSGTSEGVRKSWETRHQGPGGYRLGELEEHQSKLRSHPDFLHPAIQKAYHEAEHERRGITVARQHLEHSDNDEFLYEHHRDAKAASKEAAKSMLSHFGSGNSDKGKYEALHKRVKETQHYARGVAHVVDEHEHGSENPYKATDTTPTSTVQATWSDAARRASAEARKGNLHNEGGEMKPSTMGHNVLSVDDEGSFKHSQVWDGGHANASATVLKWHAAGEAGKSQEHPSDRPVVHAFVRSHEHKTTHHYDMSNPEHMAALHKMASGGETAKAHDATPDPLATIGAASNGVLDALSERRAQSEAVIEAAVPKPVVREPKSGMDVLAALAEQRDKPASKKNNDLALSRRTGAPRTN